MDRVTCLAREFEPRSAGRPRAAAVSAPAAGRAVYAVSAFFFIVTAAVTIFWCNSMATMQGMPMPGGWTMSMAWMRMPGQSWAGATASFAGMWAAMMAAMMFPSLAPMLARYRASLRTASVSIRDGFTALAGLGYFSIWTVLGLAIFPIGVAISAIEMAHPSLARAVPVAAGLIVLLAGALQFTNWKAHHLACCREAPGTECVLAARAGAAWRQGLRFGLHCSLSCANFTVILLVFGVMDLRVMAAVTAAITAERLAPAGQRVARTFGAVTIAAGILLVARAITQG